MPEVKDISKDALPIGTKFTYVSPDGGHTDMEVIAPYATDMLPFEIPVRVTQPWGQSKGTLPIDKRDPNLYSVAVVVPQAPSDDGKSDVTPTVPPTPVESIEGDDLDAILNTLGSPGESVPKAAPQASVDVDSAWEELGPASPTPEVDHVNLDESPALDTGAVLRGIMEHLRAALTICEKSLEVASL